MPRRDRWRVFTEVAQDAGFGIRMMRKTPVVTAAAILSLALGIGATTAILASASSRGLSASFDTPGARRASNWKHQVFGSPLSARNQDSGLSMSGAGAADLAGDQRKPSRLAKTLGRAPAPPHHQGSSSHWDLADPG